LNEQNIILLINKRLITNVLLRIFAGMAGIYFHIPFCKQKCSYCDFHFSTTFQNYRSQMIQKMVDETENRKNYLEGKNIESIYLGGGTPSLLTEVELRQLLDVIHNHFQVESNAEITLEANPDDITEGNLMMWRESGINRLSVGLQSFKKEDLEWMNRAHTVDEALNCIKLAQSKGFRNISVDLIYGLPDLTIDQWKNHIRIVLDMGVQHISAYCLTVEKKTALQKMVESNKIKPAGEDEQSDQFLILSEMLKNAGFQHYEISNFGLPDFEAVHNSNYWKRKHYLGIGPSAHSFNGISRRWNIANNASYIKNCGTENPWFEEEILSEKDQWNELILTGLRTSHGVDLLQLEKIYPLTSEFLQKLQQFEKSGWLTINEGRIILSVDGRLKADYIASELFQ